MKNVRVGLVGLGGMMNMHVQQMERVGQMEVVALCDVDSQKLTDWGERLHVPHDKRYENFQSLIRDEQVDAVISATPNDMHYAIIDTCLRYGKPVMAEKPFTKTFEEAKKLHQFAAEKNGDCFVGFSYRYVPSFRMAREWIQAGKIGQVRHVFVQYLQEWGVPLYQTPMNWRWDANITGTGVLHDLASHMVDAVRFIVADPVAVQGMLSNLIAERPDVQGNKTVQVNIDDFAAFTAYLEGDIPAVFQTSRNAYGAGNQLELIIYGDLGTLRIGAEYGERLIWIHPDETTQSKTLEKLTVPEHYKLLQMKDFKRFVLGEKTDTTPVLNDGYLNQLVLETVIRSANERKTVYLDEIESNPRDAAMDGGMIDE